MRPVPVSECDLVVRGGTVVTAGGSAECDVAVTGGRIIQLGGSMRGRREVDAAGALVLPGGLDMHVHLSSSEPPEPAEPAEPAWVDDFGSGSAAAIAGGVTTIGNMTFPADGDTLHQSLDRDLSAARALAAVDYVLHPVLVSPTPEALAELPLLAAAGHTSLKLFMVAEEFEAQADGMIEAVRIAGQHGMLTLIHCEDGALVRFAGEQLRMAGRGGLGDWAASRPIPAERAAVDRAVAICEATGSPVYIVHLSSEQALRAAGRGRSRGLPVFIETRPLYLHLTSEALAEPQGARYIGAPPLREPSDVAALWAGLADGSVDTLGSDHAPWLLRDKLDESQDVTTARQGVADLETMMPMLFSAGVRTGRISLSRFISLTATNPARLFGLYPRKGTIAVGSDADLVVLDPQLRRTVDGSAMQSRAGYSAYDGREVYGWPRFTVSRGEVVLEDGQVLARAGRGQWLPRERTAAI
ncbi:MAG TPA: amidohydrolase family protein [Streptosporangiaceae bacterium]|nr:amidohydrolase family protein [Streptosporangiaceae bacterium]